MLIEGDYKPGMLMFLHQSGRIYEWQPQKPNVKLLKDMPGAGDSSSSEMAGQENGSSCFPWVNSREVMLLSHLQATTCMKVKLFEPETCLEGYSTWFNCVITSSAPVSNSLIYPETPVSSVVVPATSLAHLME